MRIFLKVLAWLFLIMSLDMPVCLIVSHCFEMPLSTVLSAVWGLGCGILATKIVSLQWYRKEKGNDNERAIGRVNWARCYDL